MMSNIDFKFKLNFICDAKTISLLSLEFTIN